MNSDKGIMLWSTESNTDQILMDTPNYEEYNSRQRARTNYPVQNISIGAIDEYELKEKVHHDHSKTKTPNKFGSDQHTRKNFNFRTIN